MKSPLFSSNIIIPELTTSATLLAFILPSPPLLRCFITSKMPLTSPRRLHKISFSSKKKASIQTMVAIKTGRWERWERQAFLEGLRKYGQGKWKKISKLIPTRTPIQVKTHAQVILKKIATGAQVFEYLESGNDLTEKSLTPEDDEENWSNLVPSKTLHMTPNEKDVVAANILADLHLFGG